MSCKVIYIDIYIIWAKLQNAVSENRAHVAIEPTSTQHFVPHSLDFFGASALFAVFFFTEPLGRPLGRFGPAGLGSASFFFVDPLGRPLPLLTTGSADSFSVERASALAAGVAGAFRGRPRFLFSGASISGIFLSFFFNPTLPNQIFSSPHLVKNKTEQHLASMHIE